MVDNIDKKAEEFAKLFKKNFLDGHDEYECISEGELVCIDDEIGHGSYIFDVPVSDELVQFGLRIFVTISYTSSEESYDMEISYMVDSTSFPMRVFETAEEAISDVKKRIKAEESVYKALSKRPYHECSDCGEIHYEVSDGVWEALGFEVG